MLVLVPDRIFDRDDVARVAQVDLVDHRRQRRRLAGAGRAADEDRGRADYGQLSSPGAGRGSPAAERAKAAGGWRPRRGRARGAG